MNVEINSRGLSATEALYINTLDNMRYLSLKESSLQHVGIMPACAKFIDYTDQNADSFREFAIPRQNKWYALLCLVD